MAKQKEVNSKRLLALTAVLVIFAAAAILIVNSDENLISGFAVSEPASENQDYSPEYSPDYDPNSNIQAGMFDNSIPNTPASILVYPYYTSDASNIGAKDTRISITNINKNEAVIVHFFFVNGAENSPRTCTVTDLKQPLTPGQTYSILVSDFDSGETGYIIAVAEDDLGCPISFNYLIGSANFKNSQGSQGEYNAFGFKSYLTQGTTHDNCVDNSITPTANLTFNGVEYEQAPNMLYAPGLFNSSSISGENSQIVFAALNGSLLTGMDNSATYSALIYDQNEQVRSQSLPVWGCFESVAQTTLNPLLPTTGPAWIKLTAANNVPGVGLYMHYNSGTNTNAFTGADQLYGVCTTGGCINTSMTMPVFPLTGN